MYNLSKILCTSKQLIGLKFLDYPLTKNLKDTCAFTWWAWLKRVPAGHLRIHTQSFAIAEIKLTLINDLFFQAYVWNKSKRPIDVDYTQSTVNTGPCRIYELQNRHWCTCINFTGRKWTDNVLYCICLKKPILPFSWHITKL